MKILVLITRNFMQLLKIRFALDTGTPEGQIASAFGIRPYFVKNILRRHALSRKSNCFPV